MNALKISAKCKLYSAIGYPVQLLPRIELYSFTVSFYDKKKKHCVHSRSGTSYALIDMVVQSCYVAKVLSD